MELEKAFDESDTHILDIFEVRRPNETIIMTKLNHILAYTSCIGGQRGGGFLIRNELIKDIVEFRDVSERLAILKIQIGLHKLKIVQVYSPTSAANEKEIDDFYIQVTNIINQISTEKDMFIIGDFNGQIGKDKNKNEYTVGNYGYGKRIPRGWRLIRFCEEHNLKITNPFSKKEKAKFGRGYHLIRTSRLK